MPSSSTERTLELIYPSSRHFLSISTLGRRRVAPHSRRSLPRPGGRRRLAQICTLPANSRNGFCSRTSPLRARSSPPVAETRPFAHGARPPRCNSNAQHRQNIAKHNQIHRTATQHRPTETIPTLKTTCKTNKGHTTKIQTGRGNDGWVG